MHAFDTVHSTAFNSQRKRSPTRDSAEDITLSLAESLGAVDVKRSPRRTTSLHGEPGEVIRQHHVGAAKVTRDKQRNPEWLRRNGLEKQIADLEKKRQAIRRVCALRQARAFINAQVF